MKDCESDQLALLVAGDGEGRVAGDEDAPLLVADDQGRLRARVVVLEQLEGEAEPAAGAAAGLVAHVALAARLAVGATGAEEDRHGSMVATAELGAPGPSP